MPRASSACRPVQAAAAPPRTSGNSRRREQLSINLKTAEAIGLAVRQQGDRISFEVIE
jgi:hypothetical protein